MRLRSRYTFKVPEKTLEINVSHELLNLMEYSLNVRKSYIYGFTLRQEAAIGLDVSINVPQFKIILGLQFKAPISKKYALYSFKIADKARKACSSLIYSGKVRPRCLNQHIAMLISAIALKVTYGYNPPPVFYALPLIYDINELEANITNLLNRTRFINITTFPPTTFIDCQAHKIKINERTGQTTVRSNPTEIKIVNVKELMEMLRKFLKEHETVKKNKFKIVSIRKIKENLEEQIVKRLPEEKWEYARKIIGEILKTNYKFRIPIIVIP